MNSTFVKIENNVVTESTVSTTEFMQSGVLGDPSLWKQLDLDDPKRIAGVGFTYNPELDCFVPPQRYASWIFNTTTYQWEAPTLMPTDGQNYFWFEETKQWMPDTMSNTINQLMIENTDFEIIAELMNLSASIISPNNTILPGENTYVSQ